MQLAFIGLGIMGLPMALHLLKGGHPMRVYARRSEAMQPLVDAGAVACTSPADAAREAQAVFTMVSDTPDVQQVVLGEGGIIEGAPAGAIVVDMSTISPMATRRMAQALAVKGIEMLDAPVTGGDVGAINATLSIMVGGKPEVFGKIRPLFELLGRNIVYIGANGAGQVAKGCNQIAGAVTVEAIAEALTLVRKNGVDPDKVRDAMLAGFAHSRVLELYGARMINRDFKPGFKAKLHQKDLRLVVEAAAQLNIALPQSALIAQHLNALVGMGHGEEDSAQVVKVLEQLSGVEL
jgi:2-hydroxy-3-oxopropionate reductase